VAAAYIFFFFFFFFFFVFGPFSSLFLFWSAPGPVLHFRKGQFIMRRLVLKGDTADWFFGALVEDEKMEGWFPSSLVQRSRPVRGDSLDSFSSSNLLMHSSSSSVSFSVSDLKQESAAPPPSEPMMECLKVCRVTSDYKPSDSSHLALRDGEIVAVFAETETLAKCFMLDGRVGSVPSKILSVVHSKKPDAPLGRR
jgi:hypothetical protein